MKGRFLITAYGGADYILIDPVDTKLCNKPALSGRFAHIPSIDYIRSRGINVEDSVSMGCFPRHDITRLIPLD